MMYAHLCTLARRPVVVTLDLSAQNLGALQKDHPAGVSDHCLTDEWNERAPLAPPRPFPLGGQPSQRRRPM